MAAVKSGKSYFGGGARNKEWILEWGDNIRNSPQVGQLSFGQSEVGKRIFWVSNLLSEKKFSIK